MRTLTRGLTALIVALLIQTTAAQAPRRATPPDLEGIWNFSTLTPLERPAQLADKPFFTEDEAAAFLKDTLQRNNRDRRDGGAQVDVARAVNDDWFDRGSGLARIDGQIRTSLIVDPPSGRVPALTAEARERMATQSADTRAHPADGPENRSLQERCLAFNAGPPILPGPYNNFLQILQFSDHVVLFTEMIHDARIVPLGAAGRPRLGAPRWMGEPRGRYEDDTLVVESEHFNGVNDVRGSDQRLRLVERFRRVDADTVRYEFTVQNPSAFTGTWTAVLPMHRASERLFEYACHEANYALMNILRGARVQDRR